jgi:hypothetical protein
MGGFDAPFHPDVESGQLIPVRYSGSGSQMTFEIGNVTATGVSYFPIAWNEFRAGRFDTMGRLWFMDRVINPSPTPDQIMPVRVMAVDVKQLFDPPPVTLKTALNDFVIIEAENAAVSGTRKVACQTPPCPTQVIDPFVLVQSSTKSPSTTATELVTDDAGVGHVPGTASYKVWVPKAGDYQVIYDAKGPGGSSVDCKIDGGAVTSSPVNNTNWQLVAGPTKTLSAGLHTISLSRGGGTGGWHLDTIWVKRVSP